MKNKIIHITLILIIGIFTISVILLNKNSNNYAIETSGITLSNKKIEWGIKRNDVHEQPDVGKDRKKILEDNNGICIGNKDKKVIYLTFDLGYESQNTNKILDTLKENNVPATFFITAHYVNTASDLVQRMIDEGHIVGNHTVNHKSMPSLTSEELKEEVVKLQDSMKKKFNYEMKYLRPPKGEFSEKSLAETSKLGYQTVMWSFAYADWDENNQPSEEEGKNKILANLHNGEIMLLHATSKTNSNILSDVIKEIKNQGYEIKSLNDFEK